MEKKTARLDLRMGEEWLARLDGYCRTYKLTRSEAIRQLVDRAIDEHQQDYVFEEKECREETA